MQGPHGVELRQVVVGEDQIGSGIEAFQIIFLRLNAAPGGLEAGGVELHHHQLGVVGLILQDENLNRVCVLQRSHGCTLHYIYGNPRASGFGHPLNRRKIVMT